AFVSAFVSASTCGFWRGCTGTFGVDCTPHVSSLLKNVSPAEAPVTWPSSSNAVESPSVITDHFVGALESTATGIFSQAAESVVGGRLQFMLPLRSMRNSTFDGKRWLSNAELAQESAGSVSVGTEIISTPP